MSGPIQTRDSVQFALRLPRDLKERIAESAKQEGRSMNTEMVQALSMVYPPRRTLEEMLPELEAAIDRLRKNPHRPVKRWQLFDLEGMLRRIKNEGLFEDDPVNPDAEIPF